MTQQKIRPFNSILIANRGEIACRIIRSAKDMGLITIAVYSDADTSAPHVKMADQAIHIGPAPAQDSYLMIDKILDAAQQTEAEAIHPGYGFLSESAAFAKACKKAGLIFIGPTPQAITLMGDKAKAKRRMIKAGVPCVPGYHGAAQDDATLIKESKTIGFPLMVKAAAGGGGRGMRLVGKASRLLDALSDARSEALNAFGSDSLILERAIENPRHVEIQIFADQYGHTLHFGERDCSVQRRHQKVIEEAPCHAMTPALRKAMGGAAVAAAKDIGYSGAGTVEFMLDSTGNFFFLEMNTRLQVEHPVTEMVTGLDLVALQIRIARGEKLALSQSDIALKGHAIEARLYAEDPAAGFLPATGPIHCFKPSTLPDIRIDSGIETGSPVTSFYDPMLAKVIAYGDTRTEARNKLIAALKETILFGVKTNKAFLIDALTHPVFADGNVTTAFIEDNFPSTALADVTLTAREIITAAIIQYTISQNAALAISAPIPGPLLNWSSATSIHTPYRYGDTDVVVTPLSDVQYKVTVRETNHRVTVLSQTQNTILLAIDAHRLKVNFYAMDETSLSVSIDGRDYSFTNMNTTITSAADSIGAGSIIAPMHGALLSLFIAEGDTVVKGQRLAILEAMKMQHEILADIDGTISAIHVKAGIQIPADMIMIEIKA